MCGNKHKKYLEILQKYKLKKRERWEETKLKQEKSLLKIFEIAGDLFFNI